MFAMKYMDYEKASGKNYLEILFSCLQWQLTGLISYIGLAIHLI